MKLTTKIILIMKYSNNYERDYNFYLNNIRYFQFCGTLTPKHQAISDINGKTAKHLREDKQQILNEIYTNKT